VTSFAPTTVRVAWRNLWRNQRRTWLALSAIALSVMLVLAYDGIIRAYTVWILDAITGPMMGHVQVHAPEWRSDRGMDRTIRRVDDVLAAVRSDPNVADASARVYAPALAAVGDTGTGIVVVGLSVETESGDSRLLPAGQTLPRGHVLLGKALSDQLGARAGGVLAIVGQGVDGSLADALVTVHAVVETSVDLVNRQGVIMRLDEAQSLFAMPGEAHEIIVHVHRADDAAGTARRLAAAPARAGLDVLDWRALSPELVNLLGLMDAVGLIALVLVFIAAAAGVANTMLMSTFERTHEFGMLLALGTSPARVIRMIVVESIVLGLTGAGLGAAIGVALVVIAGRTGVDLAHLTGGGPAAVSALGMRMSLVFHPVLAGTDVTRAVSAVVVTAILASLWPAARAARLEPAQALRE
jgi:ABC-type lipoprotein release transport system permease subunit